MSNAKVVSIVDREVRRSRDRIQETLERIDRTLTDEVARLNERVAKLEQGGVPTPTP